MSPPDDRRGDWEKGIEESVVMLTSAQRSTDVEINDLDLLTHAHEETLHGELGTSGLIGRIEALEKMSSRLEACVFSSPGNKNGLDSRVDALEDDSPTKAKKWDFATAVTVALIGVVGTAIGLLGLLIMNWEKVDVLVNHWKHPQSELKPGKRRGNVRSVPAPEEQGKTWQ